MDKNLEESLRHIQSNPTTGTAHNQQLISSQVETIFAIDRLQISIKSLKKTIVELDQKNGQLERSNLALQRQMLILTAVATTIAVFGFLRAIGLFGGVTITLSLVSGFLVFYIQRRYVGYLKDEMKFLKDVRSDLENIKTKIKVLMEQKRAYGNKK